MKKYLLLGIIVTLGFSLNVAAQSQSRQFSENDWIEMIDNYDGLFRNHKKTDGLNINAKMFSELVNKYQGKKVTLLYARYPKGYIVNGKKRRVTIVMFVPTGGNSLRGDYIDLGGDNLCPEPECAPKD
jgi:hypothetical protein